MSETPQKTVARAYDNVAEHYLQWVKEQPSPRERYTKKVLENAPSSPHILELGCGAGFPITRMLLDHGASVVANDISSKQIEMAKASCPQATFELGDMLALDFGPESFDGIISFYAIFHLPRLQQKEVFSNISSWMKPGGMFVCSLAAIDKEEIHGELLGHGMFWSSYSVEENRRIVQEAGLDVVQAEVLEAGDGQLSEDDPDYGVKFLWLAARKPSNA